MARFFNNKQIELLAPAGNFEIFKEVVKSKCDAIYFGGRILNMRMIRKGFNLSDDELIEAVNLAHEYNKKAYITLNNLNSQEDLIDARKYLQFLATDVKPDALIVQDMSIIELITEMNLDLEIHASVMMNVHNLETVKSLDQLGISRVVVSRDFSLNTVKYFKSQLPHMEFEYFTHGDMCSVHGSQCYYSGILFGMSSNRGRCLKPCRWWYKIKKDGFVYDPKFPLAMKDMYMYEHLPEMIEAGVTSFKIEGRMREAEFIVNLVNCYGDALDRYIEDPLHYDRKKDAEYLYEHRKRDFSTCSALGNEGLNNINLRYEGTGKFYSTGKMFSKPTEEREINDNKITQIKEEIEKIEKKPKQLKLSVKVNNFEQAKLCLEKQVDLLYLSGNVYQPDLPWSIKEIKDLCDHKGQTKVVLGTPKIFDELDFERYSHLLDHNRFNLDGISVSNLGALEFFSKFGYVMYGDYAFNLYNELAIKNYQKLGLNHATLSVELPGYDLIRTIQKSSLPSETIVYGLIDVMYTDHDLYENTKVLDPIGNEDNQFVNKHILVLQNEAGEYPVFKDNRGRNHIHNTKELNLIDFIKDLATIGLDYARIEAQTYTTSQLETILNVYKNYLTGKYSLNEARELLKPQYFGFTLGALSH